MKRINLPTKTTAVVIVLIVMTVTILVLRVKLAITGTQPTLDPQERFNYLLNQAVPSEEVLQELFLQSIGEDSLRSTERRMLAADSSVVLSRVSKPEGSGPFPSIVMFHDLPSSVKSTSILSSTLGEDLSNVNQAVVISVDYRDFKQPSDVLPDAMIAVQYHEQFRETVKGPIFLIGIGGGALPVLQAALDKELAQDIAGIILVNGQSSPALVWEQLQATNQLEAKFYIQYFDCDASSGVATTTEISTEERERITRCLNEYAISGTMKDLPVLSIRTQNHAVITDSVYGSLESLFGETNVSHVLLETVDTTGNIFLNATSPEFLKARAVMSEWIETVSKVIDDKPVTEQSASESEATTSAPIILQ